MPEQNLCQTLLDQLQQSCGFDSSYLEYHLYCDFCKKLFDVNIESCTTPDCNNLKTNTSYFVTRKLHLQLKEVLEQKAVWTSIHETKYAAPKNISDITSGNRYTQLKRHGKFLDNTTNITLTMFIDGIPLYSSSTVSLWPVYLLINEIPPKECFRKKNILLWGVWQGIGKPKMNMFLRPLVLDLIQLYTDGVTVSVENDNEKEEINVKRMLVFATMDPQARAYATNMTHHNGEFGCLYCLESGLMVQTGKGRCRAYLVNGDPEELCTYENARKSAALARETGSRTVSR